ncbi:hypothetical protein A3D77_01155 [Candidatus Gottesmanbacteria bacterium RIFCSPHIGHO2_02_FULL_39_11]|uniref:Prepilin-type N-terminal cleavage/methylation domain-containing protein n=1 Tax=Candidatus Gottesmanbacteria bacterium RIFCSPHIGHO2_02_FULL_39_11 TaxID=1798382 RepID=A0A1F5ZJK2_9BACT|nr:MAG: hypothetical protein A3D77_01155 [Candidatus Gottesmanbacteria bacterium RIFCSPHIGHO2_02_FULL_39_11]
MKKNTGLTLIELIIYVTILLTLLAVTTKIFSSLIDSQLETSQTSSVEQDSRYIFARLSSDISRATSITTPSLLGQTSGTLTLVINGLNSTYSLNGNNLELSDNYGLYQLNSFGSTVSNLSFQRLGNASGKPSIKVTFTLSSTAKRNSQSEVKTYSTTIGTR